MSKTSDILEKTANTIEEFPHRAEELLDLIAPVLHHTNEITGGQKLYHGSVKLLWNKLLVKRDDLAEKFLTLAFTSPKQHFLMGEVLRDSEHRQNMTVMSMAFEHAKKLGDDMAGRVMRTLLGSAIRDAIIDEDSGLFDLLLQQPATIDGTWDNSVGKGNALFLWQTCQPVGNSLRYQTEVAYTLARLLDVGAKQDEPILFKMDDNKVLNFNSLISMVCWKVDSSDINSISTLNHLLDAGINWNGCDQGKSKSARLIRQHPIVIRHALGDFLDDKEIFKKKGPGVKM